jgi:hypothetical protein
MTLETIFKQGRIIGFAGVRNCGKTNNLTFLIKQFRKTNKETPIFIYGFPREVTEYLRQYNIKEIDSLNQLINKKDCILIIDEMQRLKLNDKRYVDIKNQFADFVYHNNVYTILTSPSIREFNSIIGSIIEGWIVKTIRIDQCINGSQLKDIVGDYRGNYSVLGNISIPESEILVLNKNESIVLHCDYIEEADTKKGQKDLFWSKKSQ